MQPQPPPQPPIWVPTGPPGHSYDSQSNRPSVVVYFKAYCGFMAFVYLLVLAMGVLLLLLPSLSPGTAGGPGTGEAIIAGGVYIMLGLVLSIPYGFAVFVGPKPWVHTFGIILIGLSLTSCACIPIALPLLLAWIKPEVKAWYREAAASP